MNRFWSGTTYIRLGFMLVTLCCFLIACQSHPGIELQQQEHICQLDLTSINTAGQKLQTISAGMWLVGIDKANLEILLQELNAKLENYDAKLAVAQISTTETITHALPMGLRFIEAASVPRERHSQFEGDLSKLEWGLQSLRLPENLQGQGVTIAVVDDGIAANHEEFTDRVVIGFDAFSQTEINPGSNQGNEENFHGTHVAGLALAAADATGITGIAPEAQLMPVRIFDGARYAGDLATARAIVWAVDNGADIINNSWGGPTYSSLLYEAVSYAMGHGVVVVTSAGNHGLETFDYPGSYPGVIRVGASTPQGKRASFSDSGSGLSVLAPGVEMISTFPEQSYAFLSGTSMATPLVAGALALALEANPTWTAYELKEALEQSALDLEEAGWDEQTGFGLLNPAGLIAGTPDAGANLYLSGLPTRAELRLSQGQQAFFLNASSSGEAAFHLLKPQPYSLRIVAQGIVTEGTVNLLEGDNHCNF